MANPRLAPFVEDRFPAPTPFGFRFREAVVVHLVTEGETAQTKETLRSHRRNKTKKIRLVLAQAATAGTRLKLTISCARQTGQSSESSCVMIFSKVGFIRLPQWATSQHASILERINSDGKPYTAALWPADEAGDVR